MAEFDKALRLLLERQKEGKTNGKETTIKILKKHLQHAENHIFWLYRVILAYAFHLPLTKKQNFFVSKLIEADMEEKSREKAKK